VRDLSVKTTSGDIAVNAANSNAANLKTVSGNITASLPGSHTVELHTTSGDIIVDSAAWQVLTAESVSGNVRISGKASEQTSLKTVSGDVVLAPGGKIDAISYDIKSVSGDIVVNGQRMRRSAQSDSSARPANAVTIKTTSGNIQLNCAK
jgi:DUF4097 and DUF4098 domain-containing protein YvlB